MCCPAATAANTSLMIYCRSIQEFFIKIRLKKLKISEIIFAFEITCAMIKIKLGKKSLVKRRGPDASQKEKSNKEEKSGKEEIVLSRYKRKTPRNRSGGFFFFYNSTSNQAFSYFFFPLFPFVFFRASYSAGRLYLSHPSA